MSNCTNRIGIILLLLYFGKMLISNLLLHRMKTTIEFVFCMRGTVIKALG